MSAARDALLANLEENRLLAEHSPSPFYAVLLARMADDVRAGGPTWDLLAPFAHEAAAQYHPFRALAGVHHDVLAGRRPALEAHYPSTGGDGDAAAAWPQVRAAFAEHDSEVVAELAHPLQTNETSRCGALIGGFGTVSTRFRRPLAVLELGASAGLNLHFDHYRYEAAGAACGPVDSPVRFVDYWREGIPPLDPDLRVVARAGCDLAPVDVSTPQGRLELQACVFADQVERLALLRRALEVADRVPVQVARAGADAWIAAQLDQPRPGVATVVFHSIFWTYLPADVQASITATIEAAGARATADAPLAWLRYEEGAVPTTAELRLRTWGDADGAGAGSADALLAVGGYHWNPVRWVAERA
jgi:hypothetical protein